MPRAPARRANRTSSEVAKLVRLHHRRRGWAWVATGSLLGLGVYAGIDRNLFDGLTGTAEILSAIAVFVLLGRSWPGSWWSSSTPHACTTLPAPPSWQLGRGLIMSDGTAIENIIAGLFFDAVTLLLVYAVVVIVRGKT